MIIHGLQNMHPVQILQSRSDKRDSMSGGSLAVNPAHESRAFGEARRRLAKIVSEGDSLFLISILKQLLFFPLDLPPFHPFCSSSRQALFGLSDPTA